MLCTKYNNALHDMAEQIQESLSPEVRAAGFNVLPVFDERTGTASRLYPTTALVDGVAYFSRASLLEVLGVTEEKNNGTIDFPCGLQIHPADKVVTINQLVLPRPLSPREFSIVHAIAATPYPRAIARNELRLAVYGDLFGAKNVVDVTLSNAKFKLGAGGPTKEYPDGQPNMGLFQTVRGRGFRMGPRAYDPEPLVSPR